MDVSNVTCVCKAWTVVRALEEGGQSLVRLKRGGGAWGRANLDEALRAALQHGVLRVHPLHGARELVRKELDDEGARDALFVRQLARGYAGVPLIQQALQQSRGVCERGGSATARVSRSPSLLPWPCPPPPRGGTMQPRINCPLK